MGRKSKDITEYKVAIKNMLEDGKTECEISAKLGITRRQVRKVKEALRNPQTEIITIREYARESTTVRPISETKYTDLQQVLAKALTELQKQNPVRDKIVEKITQHLDDLEKMLKYANEARDEFLSGDIDKEQHKAKVDAFYRQMHATETFIKGRKAISDIVSDKTVIQAVGTVAGTMAKMQALPTTDISKSTDDESLKDNELIKQFIESAYD